MYPGDEWFGFLNSHAKAYQVTVNYRINHFTHYIRKLVALAFEGAHVTGKDEALMPVVRSELLLCRLSFRRISEFAGVGHIFHAQLGVSAVMRLVNCSRAGSEKSCEQTVDAILP